MTERLQSYDQADESLSDFEHEAQSAFEDWALSHAGGRLEVLPYDLRRFPDERFDIVELAANPSLEVARYAGEHVMGPAAYGRLVDNYKRLEIVELVEAAGGQEKPKSTLIATAHLEDILDTSIAHNALFVASGKANFAHKNVVIANPMIKRLGININGELVAVTDVLRLSGRIIFALPETAAINFGMPPEAVSTYRRTFAPLLRAAASEGCAIHWALTGTRGVDIVLDSGTAAKMLPRISDSIANIARKRTPQALGIVMDLESEDGLSRVLPPKELKDIYDVHLLMSDIATATSQISRKWVVYGLPQRAVIAGK